MGGEKYLPCFNADGFVGSPPRWRGKAVKFRCTCGLQRITPAWAGKSKLALCTPSCPTDHPRAGREKNKELEGVWLPMGSPPRRRGKERSTALVGTPTRITPALAGKSYVFGPFRPGSWDHPRVGGEKRFVRNRTQLRLGSPPRGRGKGPLVTGKGIDDRITPAWAGKSCFGEVCVDGLEDHPRVGGEKLGGQQLRGLFGGSPPRGRGKEHDAAVAYGMERITPAWAGKSGTRLDPRCAVADHPRVGGEKSTASRPAVIVLGSPPRGRGKVGAGAVLSRLSGITPAWAGESLSVRGRCRTDRDHPRVGGEKMVPWLFAVLTTGSPPRGRGKVPAEGDGIGVVGITPAWAGKR